MFLLKISSHLRHIIDAADVTFYPVFFKTDIFYCGMISPTEDNILAGTYVLQRPFVMATMGEISEQNDLVKAFFDFIHSEEGQQVITSVGLIIPQ